MTDKPRREWSRAVVRRTKAAAVATMPHNLFREIVRRSMRKMIFALAVMLPAAAMADETVRYEEKAFYPCDKPHIGWSTPTVDPENNVRHLIEDHPMTKSGEYWKVIKVENIHREDDVMPHYTVPECRATVRTDHGDFDYDWFFVSDDRGATWTISGTIIRFLSK